MKKSLSTTTAERHRPSKIRQPSRFSRLVGLSALAAVAAGTFAAMAFGVISITANGFTYTQNFDTPTLANTGSNITWTNDITINGWYSTRTTYNASDGSSNSGQLYSFGTTGSNDRALGAVASGTSGTIQYGARFHNDTGVAIAQMTVSYTGEQWRDGGAATPAAQTTNFQYLVAPTITDLTTGTYIDVDALDFTSPVFTNTTTGVALDGNAAANRTARSATFAVNIPAGQEIMIKWVDANDPGNDHGLAVDDLSVKFNTTTAVALRGFSTARSAGGAVVRWQTGAETDTLGYNVIRVGGGASVKVNRSLIGASFAGNGGAYKVVDRTARPGVAYTYRLQTVSLRGTKSFLAQSRLAR